ncbi:hypothetical protein C2845_PM03G28760 [Panicum miliaceum]|uniref:Uncharacterized protein n=1 Tax=Panicum miliaceum TaxID=4540 RepID=A0A3L6T3K3_PANMI|nr:hypothetical protein C2845_PM03G28760 [Panicum miliaceum]
MWTTAKNKHKKLSPSSSRRLHGTTSSRDNMSVDSSHRDTDSQEDASPAVPRSHVQGRIRVLTSVEQLVSQNDYEREALDLLKNQMYHHVRILEPLFFIKTGLKADMTRAFSHVWWYNFADMTEAEDDSRQEPIDITTLVTRIAMHIKALDNAQVTFLPWGDEYQLRVGLEHFVQGHMMHEGPGNSLFMTYPGCRKRSQLVRASPAQQLDDRYDQALSSKNKQGPLTMLEPPT